METLLILADDLTGTVDTGAFPVSYGRQVTAYIDYQTYIADENRGEVVSVNMGTRALPPKEAAERHLMCAPAVNSTSGTVIKKMDMGLRGNPACEILTLLQNTNRKYCFMMPAIPEFMTFTLYGYEFVKGCLLEKSLYADDPLHIITSSYIPEILEGTPGICCGSIDIDAVKSDWLKAEVDQLLGEGKNVIVFDAVSDQDCFKVVDTLMQDHPDVIWAGTLGLISAVCRYLYGEKQDLVKVSDTRSRGIGFCGSNYTVSKDQIRYAAQHAGLQVINFDIENYAKNPKEELAGLKSRYDLSNGTSDIMILPLVKEAYAIPELISKGLEDAAATVLEGKDPDRIIIIGGETASNVFRRIGISKLKITEKPESGIAAGLFMDGPFMGKAFALKGGSVGTEQAVVRMFNK